MDSTGVKVRRAGGWVERKHGKKKRYVKLHFAVDVETKEIVAMEGVHGRCARCQGLSGSGKEADEKRRIACRLGDGVYDSGAVFEELEAEALKR